MTAAIRLIFILAILVPGLAAAANVDELVAECDSCHGQNGVSSHPDMPIIAGQSPNDIAKQLRAVQRWDRPCVKTKYRSGDISRPKTDMCQVAGTLSSEDIQALSNHYSTLPFKPAQQPFDETLAMEGAALHEQYCETCHANGGKTAGRGPRLAGQWTQYLETTLKFVPTGEHLVPPKMERTVTDFNPADIDRLMNFYASQQD